MDLRKITGVFDPIAIAESIHVVGCGSVGSHIAPLLARNGLTKIHLWDFDKVESKNISNQQFFEHQIGKAKVEALKENLVAINEDCAKTVVVHPDGWHGEELSGYVFLCVDSIQTRAEIVKANQYNFDIVAMFDVRTGLHDAQSYAADWSRRDEITNLLRTMNFTDEEAKDEVPRSACGEELGLVTTVDLISVLCVINFMNFIEKRKVKKSLMAVTNLDVEGIVIAP